MKRKFSFLFFLFLSISLLTWAQKYYRITGDYSIKAKSFDGKSQLTAGKFYYDLNYKKLVYCNSFPAVDVWVSFDTVTYRIVDNKVTKRYLAPPLSEFSIFHLALTSQIKNYGLNASGFTIQKVEKNNNMVITTWMPPAHLKKIFGKVLISVKENRLSGLIFIDSEGTVIRKQFFDKYDNFLGVEFPLEVVDITYTNGLENYQVTSYKNIMIDEVYSNDFYNYPIPD